MFRSEHVPASRDGQRRPWSVGALRLAALLAGAALPVSFAFASGSPSTVRAAKNSALNATVVVDSHGRTLYALSPETTRHPLCKTAACFAAWPPLTVRSRHAKLKRGHGVHGHLGIFKRSNGKLQVTLRGKPLYRFAGDTAKGQANGDGITSFGGTWHAVTAGSSSTPPTTTTMPTTTTPPMTTTTTPYIPPGY